VDETHPPRPVNSYALSKLVGEQTAEYFSRTRGLEVLSFRIMGTRTPEELPEETAAMGADPAAGAWLLWTRTDARDVATACRLAVEVDAVESGVYNITGPRVAIDTPTMELIGTHFGDQTEIRGQIDGYDSPLSCEKARLAFGYKPKHSWAEGVDTAATVQVAPAGARL
jgi:nucleoside-diphosphate-sugar epimerase